MSNVHNMSEKQVEEILLRYIPVMNNMYREPIEIFRILCEYRNKLIIKQSPRPTINGKTYHFDFTVIDKEKNLFVGIEVMKMDAKRSDLSFRVNRLIINSHLNPENEIILLGLGGGYSADNEAIMHLRNIANEMGLPITIMHTIDEFVNHFKNIYE